MDERARRSAAETAGLRSRLAAVGRFIGVRMTVTDDATWQVDGDGVRVGLGFHASRGHGPDESVALSLLEIWSQIRSARVAPEQTARSLAISRLHPDLAPLVATVERLLAAAELMQAMPAVRGALGYGTVREVPADLTHWSLHVQWLGMLLRRGLAPGAEVSVEPAVHTEMRQLDRAWMNEAGDSTEPSEAGRRSDDNAAPPEGVVLRRLMQPAPERTPLQRFERALAAVAAPYLRLQALAAARIGLAAPESSTGSADNHEHRDEESVGWGGAEPQENHEPAQSGAGDDAASDPDAQRARPGEWSEAAEGSDLFEAEQAAFLRTILPTPLPARGQLVEALHDQISNAEASNTSSAPPVGERRGAGGTGKTPTTSLRDYRVRVQQHADAIEAMRDIWQHVVSRRISPRLSLSRTPEVEGETLATEHLAQTVAEVHAGVPEPRAFRRRMMQARRTQAAGSTDYVLLIDRSGSMQGAQADHAADAALIMLEGLAGAARDISNAEATNGIDLELGIRTSLIVFDADALVVKPLASSLDDQSRQTLHAAVRSPSGATNDRAALRAAARELGVDDSPGTGSGAPPTDGVSRKRIIIVVSDGGSNDPSAAVTEARRLRKLGVRVWGIGIGNDEIVARYAPTSRRVDRPHDLPAALHDIIERERDE